MRKSSWDGVHRVGTDLTVLFTILLRAGRNFAQAPDFHDFKPDIICYCQSWGKISPSVPVSVNLTSFGTVSSLLPSNLCF